LKSVFIIFYYLNTIIIRRISKMQVVDITQLKQIVAKSTEFFGDHKRYKPFANDIEA